MKKRVIKAVAKILLILSMGYIFAAQGPCNPVEPLYGVPAAVENR